MLQNGAEEGVDVGAQANPVVTLDHWPCLEGVTFLNIYLMVTGSAVCHGLSTHNYLNTFIGRDYMM